jgi:hypothetical protein
MLADLYVICISGNHAFNSVTHTRMVTSSSDSIVTPAE